MLEQRDHRGKLFTIPERPARESAYARRRDHEAKRDEQLERQAQRELRLLAEAKQ